MGLLEVEGFVWRCLVNSNVYNIPYLSIDRSCLGFTLINEIKSHSDSRFPRVETSRQQVHGNPTMGKA